MTRQYATFDCGMWDDPEGFASLSSGAQRTYFMLVTQRDIAACGTLPLTLRRWSRTCMDDGTAGWLAELVERSYVLIDEDTEELLVRTFMKWDAGYKHAKRVRAVIASALAIRSLSIRSAALAELASLGVPIPDQNGTELLRSVVTEVSTNHTPETALQKPETSLPEGEPSGASAEPPSLFCSKHPNGTEKSCGPCGTAKLRYAAWVKSKAGRDALERVARQTCPDCFGDSWLENGERCDHPKTRRTA